jgi:hypothetical protein
MWTFDHERLDVYQVAIEFVGDASETATEIPEDTLPCGTSSASDDIDLPEHRRGSWGVQRQGKGPLLQGRQTERG